MKSLLVLSLLSVVLIFGVGEAYADELKTPFYELQDRDTLRIYGFTDIKEPTHNEKVLLQLFDPEGNMIFSGFLMVDDDGHYFEDFKIKKWDMGEYEIKSSYKEESRKFGFNLESVLNDLPPEPQPTKIDPLIEIECERCNNEFKQEYDTKINGNYVIEFEFEATGVNGNYDIKWNGIKIAGGVADHDLDSTSFEFTATTEKGELEIIGDDVVFGNISVGFNGMSNLPTPTNDEDQNKIAELELKIDNLEKENSRLQGVIETLEKQIETMTNDFYQTILDQMNWFRNRN